MLIKAFNGNPRVFVGEREVAQPTTLEQATATYGADKVLKGFWKSEVIAVQASIRLGTNGNPNLSKFKSLSKAKQDELLALMEDATS